MTDSPFAKPSDYAGASYFDPKKHMTALALLIEPKTIEKNVPSTYANQTRVRDEVIADITVFENQAALDSGQPTTILKSTKIVHSMLTSTVEKILGGAMVGVVTKIPTQNGSGYVFRDVDSATEAAVGTYYSARSAAIAAAPSFEN
jgi:hypothetical protein